MKYNEDYLNVRKSVCVCLCVYMCVWVTLLKSRLIDHYKSTIIENIKILQKKKKRLSTPIKGDGWSLMLRRKIKGEGRGREGRREERREAGRQAGMVDLNAEPHTHLNSLF